ncbi:hypothetical protein Syun_029859 [Stephania yunnanensis]|uniref:Uncharacterized protein n=1 Tax=Stephania yunnanensis TaxID=152371 RepID=A0AAP0HLR6_9MAGN
MIGRYPTLDKCSEFASVKYFGAIHGVRIVCNYARVSPLNSYMNVNSGSHFHFLRIFYNSIKQSSDMSHTFLPEVPDT